YNSGCGCGSSSYSSSCDCGSSGGMCHRLRGLFSRGGHGHSSDCGCDGGCGTSGYSGSCGSTYNGGTYSPTPYTPGVPAQQGESLTVPPKKMPAPPVKEAAPAPKQ